MLKQDHLALSSSKLGSIGLSSDLMRWPAPGYKISKAALNMLTVQYATELKAEGFTFISINPGVSTSSEIPSPMFVFRTN